MIEIIVAMAKDNVIGNKGKLPWGHLPRDLAHFKEITDKQTIVIGFNTLVSIRKELPGRNVLVLTHNPAKLALFPWCEAVTEVEDVLEMAKTKRIIVAGGEVVYREFLPHTSTIHLTKVHASLDGDTRFPWLSPDEWHLVPGAVLHHSDEKNEYPMTFQTWVRRECVAEKMAA